LPAVEREVETVITAEEAFRRLAIGDQKLIAAIGDVHQPHTQLHRLGDRTAHLLRIAALVALDAPQSSYDEAVGGAQRGGADLDELLGVLEAIAGLVGSARVIAAAPRVALAAGYDIEAALERNTAPDHAADALDGAAG
jgi:4-carboxymuconolactone decarboxylase